MGGNVGGGGIQFLQYVLFRLNNGRIVRRGKRMNKLSLYIFPLIIKVNYLSALNLINLDLNVSGVCVKCL